MKLTTLLLLVLAVPAFAQDKAPDEKLCSIKTVFIEGHGSTFRLFREKVEDETWLKLEDVKPNADAIVEIGGVGSVAFPVNIKLTRREPEEFIYEDSARATMFKMWGDTPVETILKKLNKAANCQKL